MGRYMPERGNGAILTTSRKPNLGFGLTDSEIQINPFSAQEGTKCILGLATWQSGVERDSVAASELNEKLGGLPLGITQMVALMRAKAMSIRDFITLYEQNKGKMHKLIRRGGRHSGYELDLSTVWQMSFRSVVDSPSAMFFLGILCFLSPSLIPQALFGNQEDIDGKCARPLFSFCDTLTRCELLCPSRFGWSSDSSYR